MTATLALIVRCFNEEAHIGRLLTGVTRQTRLPEEIILVDSGSTDATLAIASAFGVRVVSVRPEEFSFGRALNVGLRAASEAEIAVFASAHVYPIYDTWLEQLVGALQDDEVALAYGRQETPPAGRFSEQRLMAQWFPPSSVARQSHPFCNNANAAIRRSVWCGTGYDEELTGLEDLDWAGRVMARGFSISYVAEAPVIHVHDESFSQVLNRYRREAIAHKEIYPEQRFGARHASRLAAANIFRDCMAAARHHVLREHLVDITSFRIAQFCGSYRGFAQSGPVTDVLRRRFYYPAAAHSCSGHQSSSPVGRRIDYDDPARR